MTGSNTPSVAADAEAFASVFLAGRVWECVLARQGDSIDPRVHETERIEFVASPLQLTPNTFSFD